MAIDREFRRARERGIDVNQVGQSLAHYLSEERRLVRDNPKLLERHTGPDNLSVAQRNAADRVYWETLGELPSGVEHIKVFATTREAVINKTTVPELLDRRYRREFALGLQRAGEYEDTLEGRRAAMKRAMDASVFVATVDL